MCDWSAWSSLRSWSMLPSSLRSDSIWRFACLSSCRIELRSCFTFSNLALLEALPPKSPREGASLSIEAVSETSPSSEGGALSGSCAAASIRCSRAAPISDRRWFIAYTCAFEPLFGIALMMVAFSVLSVSISVSWCLSCSRASWRSALSTSLSSSPIISWSFSFSARSCTFSSLAAALALSASSCCSRSDCFSCSIWARSCSFFSLSCFCSPSITSKLERKCSESCPTDASAPRSASLRLPVSSSRAEHSRSLAARPSSAWASCASSSALASSSAVASELASAMAATLDASLSESSPFFSASAACSARAASYSASSAVRRASRSALSARSCDTDSSTAAFSATIRSTSSLRFSASSRCTSRSDIAFCSAV
mmetsp:Transcript_29624/g.96496  ORF Transcript_29624/g.96496 Transcript_29624/m.96496 type:complete len:371 (-) Transcript_29624:344-1456(-)